MQIMGVHVSSMTLLIRQPKFWEKKLSFSQHMNSTGGKFVSYAFAGIAGINTAISAFNKNPEKRAKKRKYKLI